MFSRIRYSQFESAIEQYSEDLMRTYLKDWRSTVSASALFDAVINQGVCTDVARLLDIVDAVPQKEHENVGRVTLAARLITACEEFQKNDQQPMINGMKRISVQGKNYEWRESFRSYWTLETVDEEPVLKKLFKSDVKGPVLAWEESEPLPKPSKALKM